MASKMVAKKKILFFPNIRVLLNTNYDIIDFFAGFLINVDDFLGKTEISMGNTLKYAKSWSFNAPICSFLRVPGEAKT